MRSPDIRKITRAFGFGLIMGTSELIPAMGATTIALVLGIYDELIEFIYSLTEFLLNSLRFLLAPSYRLMVPRGTSRRVEMNSVYQSFLKIDWQLGGSLILGSLFAILAFSSAVLYLVSRYPSYIYATLLGIVLAFSTIPLREIKKYGWKEIAILVGAFLVATLIFRDGKANPSFIPGYFLMFVSGILVVVAMILPGISISLLLLILNVYYFLLKSATQLTHFTLSVHELSRLAVFGLGLITGFLTVSRGLKYLLDNFRDQFLAAALGLVYASARILWPFVRVNPDGSGDLSVVPLNNFTSNEVAQVSILFLIVFAVCLYISNKVRDFDLS